jgi:hypothetical protein
MTCEKFYSKLKTTVEKRDDLTFSSCLLKYKNGNFDFWRIQSKDIKKTDRVILLCAGVHGEEIAGPLTFYKHVDKVVRYVHNNNLKLIIYPLRNPSGFEKGLRYNIDLDKGEGGNNDFMRYELKSGKIVDDLKDKNVYKKWQWSSDPKLKIKLPKETSLFHKLLKKDFKYNIVACLDLHQDFITPNSKAAAYHYGFGKTEIYKTIIKEIEKIVPIWKNKYIGAGFNTVMTAKGAIQKCVPKEDLIKSDKLGFVQRFDGTLGDLTYRLGAKFSVTVETTGATKLNDALAVNMVWIKGMVDLLK